MDGSSKYFVEAIEAAGIVEQDAPRYEYVVKQVITYVNEETGSEITLIPAEEYQVTTMVDFGTKVLGTQNAYLNKLSDFKKGDSWCSYVQFLTRIGDSFRSRTYKRG